MTEYRATTFEQMCSDCFFKERSTCHSGGNDHGDLVAEHCPRWAELPPASTVHHEGQMLNIVDEILRKVFNIYRRMDTGDPLKEEMRGALFNRGEDPE